MDEQTKQLLADLAKGFELQKAHLERVGAAEEQIKQLQNTVEEQRKQIQASALQRKQFDGFTTDGEKRDALGALMRGLHAQAIAGKAGKALDRLGDSELRDMGYMGEAKELSDHMLQKAAQASSDTSGGVFVSHDTLGTDWIKLLRPNNKVLLEAGATWTDLPERTGRITIPRQKSLPTFSATSENGSVTTSDMAWEQISLTPKRAAGGGFISKTFLFSAPEYLRIFEDQCMYQALRQIQFWALYGVGAEGQTKGIYNEPGTTKYYISSTDGTSSGAIGRIFNYTDVAALEEQLALANGRIEGAKLITRPEVIRGAKAFKYAQYSGDTVGMPGFNFSPSDTLLSDEKLRGAMGYDYYRLTDVKGGTTVGSNSDCAHAFFGQFDNVGIYTWGGIKLKVSAEATLNGTSAFENNLMALIADVDYDVLIRQPKELLVVMDARTVKQ